jgi:hypothetical protein
MARSPMNFSDYTAGKKSVQACDALVTRFSRGRLLCYGSRQRDLATQEAPIMSNRRRGYVAYLLRMWQVEERENAPWRASLESPQTGERRGFASLVDLFSFLEKETCQVVRDQPAPNRGEKGGDIDT